ncbi:MAG: heme ABC exporter ATP-binding protein CcmA [Gammaproteobacteria bacterium]|nr:heme ABC exporter ATP-binding protein CcmA [Gammaproteobacteria bacterium]
MNSAALLDVQDFCCERDGRVLFDGLGLTLLAGQCLELRGPNGSGKSTLLRAIAGLFPDYGGTIEARESLYLGHRPGISALLTAEENLRWYQTLRPGRSSVSAALTEVGMAGYERVACQHMSAGQQRRVGLARLVLCRAPLWLLDEPLTALDSAGSELVRRLIADQLEQGGAVLCATHQPLRLRGSQVLSLGAADAEFDREERQP